MTRVPNSLITMTYIDGELASTVRVHVITDEGVISPALDVFPDVLEARLRERRVIIDPSRLAARADMAKRFPELPYFALRPPWMAAHHFNAGFIVVSCAIGHLGYYRRTFRAQAWSDLRSYPKVTAKVMCVGLEFRRRARRRRGALPVFPLNAGRTRSPFRRVLVVARVMRGRAGESPCGGGAAKDECVMT